MPSSARIGTAELHLGDCLGILPTLSRESVALALTSPPYNCGKRYGVFGDDLSWDDYWRFTDRWLRLLQPLLIPGGRLAVNLPWWMGKKASSRRTLRLQDRGLGRRLPVSRQDHLDQG